jgi:hypothetical protein
LRCGKDLLILKNGTELEVTGLVRRRAVKISDYSIGDAPVVVRTEYGTG